MFVPRLEAPDWNNKLWINVGFGGYNHCIPIYGGPSVTPNCFVGETRIVTREGTVRLDSIVDKTIEVLSEGGVYRKATGIYCGRQHIYRVTLGNNRYYDCTANHRWIIHRVSTYKGKRYDTTKIKTTLDLNNCDYIPYVYIRNEEKSP